jgi:hypothetical protein
MDPDITSALLNYYQLKQSYEESINTKKLRILRNPSLSKREKRQKFLQMKTQCVKCNQIGGTIFRVNDTVLTAICGNKDTPCDLNIKINRGSFINIREMYKNIIDDIETVQNDIIKTKLNLLFNYSNEQEVISEFENLRSLFEKDTDILEYTKKEFINIVDNRQRNNELNNKLQVFYNLIDRLKILHKEYHDRHDTGLINDIVELYISEIKPLVTEIRLLQYKYCNVEKNDKNIFNLIEEPYTYEDLFIPDDDNEPAVISNVF